MGVRLELCLLIYNCGKYTILLACRQKAKEKKCRSFPQKTKKTGKTHLDLTRISSFDTKEVF